MLLRWFRGDAKPPDFLFSDLVVLHGFRHIHGRVSLSEWEMRTGEIAWRVLVEPTQARLYVYTVDPKNGDLLPCISAVRELDELVSLVREIASLPAFHEDLPRDRPPCVEFHERLGRVEAPEPPWRSTGHMPLRWILEFPKQDASWETPALRLVEPLFVQAGFFAKDGYWIREQNRQATIIQVLHDCVSAANWRQAEDSVGRAVDGKTIAHWEEAEAEDVAARVHEWLKQR